MTPPIISFEAEIIKCEVKKTVSNDKEYRIIVVTPNSASLQLERFINEAPVKIKVEKLE